MVKRTAQARRTNRSSICAGPRGTLEQKAAGSLFAEAIEGESIDVAPGCSTPAITDDHPRSTATAKHVEKQVLETGVRALVRGELKLGISSLRCDQAVLLQTQGESRQKGERRPVLSITDQSHTPARAAWNASRSVKTRPWRSDARRTPRLRRNSYAKHWDFWLDLCPPPRPEIHPYRRHRGRHRRPRDDPSGQAKGLPRLSRSGDGACLGCGEKTAIHLVHRHREGTHATAGRATRRPCDRV